MGVCYSGWSVDGLAEVGGIVSEGLLHPDLVTLGGREWVE